MDNQSAIEISEAELDEVFGGAGRFVVCAQAADTACPGPCCVNV